MAADDGTGTSADDWRRLALTNLGHFTTVRVENGRARGLALHLARLAADCQAVFDAPLDTDGVRQRMARAVRGRTGPQIVRVTVFDPSIGLADTGAEARPRPVVTVRPAAVTAPAPLRVQSRVYVRDLPAVKHTGLFGSLYQRRQARRAGFDDALFLDAARLVTEGTTWNVGFWDGERVVWPQAEVLPGVTMRLLQGVTEHRTRPVLLRPAEIRAAFATNAAVGVRPLCGIDGTELPADHPVLRELRAAYREIPAEPLS